MKTLLRFEEFFLFLFSIFLFMNLDFAWWWYPLLILAPDLGMLGYVISPRVGAHSYNLVHHRGLAVFIFVMGFWLAAPTLQLAGVIMLGHASLDRVFGYGLKHTDSFQHTHLGWIGESAAGREIA